MTHNSFKEILRTIDPGTTNDAPGNTYIEVLSQKAAIVKNYVSSKYYEDLSELPVEPDTSGGARLEIRGFDVAGSFERAPEEVRRAGGEIRIER